MLPTSVLQFSGGKDSLACLYLLEPHWPEITVAWVNTDAALPETIEQMDEVRAMVPHFLEIPGVQTIDVMGYPADLVPVSSTAIGQQTQGTSGRRFQSRIDCCAAALWIPTVKAMKQLGATVIIRGQKKSDAKRVPVPSGTVVEGVRYEFPLEDWSDADVFEYLAERGVKLPRHYQTMSTGLDCWNCTAYLDENEGKLEYMRKFHRQRYEQLLPIYEDLKAAIARETSILDSRLSPNVEHENVT